MNAQDFSRQGRRRRRPFRDVSPYKRHTWKDVQKKKLSDLVNFAESYYPKKSMEEVLTTVVDLVSELKSRESEILSPSGSHLDISIEEVLKSSKAVNPAIDVLAPVEAPHGSPEESTVSHCFVSH
jgi:hypothetical protein